MDRTRGFAGHGWADGGPLQALGGGALEPLGPLAYAFNLVGYVVIGWSAQL
ncbi:MAG: hypothetical protein AAGH43_08070 [Pseudomonadota bacterium]